MPGIIGYVSHSYENKQSDLLNHMASALESEDRFKVNLYQEPSVGLGRISLGITNPESQPIWNEDESICAVMEGELYDYQQLKKGLIERGHKFRLHNDVEFFLHLYEEYGDNFAVKLNGAFIAAIWDKKNKTLRIVNDRLGLYPFYYAQLKDDLIFGSGVRAILAEQSLSRQVDRVALAEFLTFDHMLHDHTFLQAVHLLPQASIMTFSERGLKIHHYWRVKHPETYLLRNEEDLMDELLFHLKQAVNRQKEHDELPAAILLSGGLDSRVLLTYLVDNKKDTLISSFTWGIPGCDDIKFAQQISALLGSRHHTFELRSDWLLDQADEAVRITDGMGNLVNLHALATLEAESAIAKIIYKGFLGDAMMGFGLRHQLWSQYNDPITTSAHLQVHNDQGVITFDPMSDHKDLFTEAFQKEINTAVIDNYNSGMKDAGTPMLADQRIYFDFYQRVPRMTIKGVEVARHRTIVRLPFADNELVEFSLTIPPGLRYQRRLMKNAVIKAFPKLAQIPITETGLPMMSCSRDIRIRIHQLIRWHLHYSGLKWVTPDLRRPYKDYDNWFRTILRPWIENILLSERFMQRGYYNPGYIRSLVAEHMNGTNHAVRIGALMSIELWHRQFLD